MQVNLSDCYLLKPNSLKKLIKKIYDLKLLEESRIYIEL